MKRFRSQPFFTSFHDTFENVFGRGGGGITIELGDRSFFIRKGGLVGFGGGGPLKKNWLERGGQPKKNEGKGGVGRKN